MLGPSAPAQKEDKLATSFGSLMSQGKTKAALGLLDRRESGIPLQLDDMVDVGPLERKLVKDVLVD